MSDSQNSDLSLDRSNIIWHPPVSLDMTDGAPTTSDIPVDRFDTKVDLHPTIEFDMTQSEPRVDEPPENGKKATS